MDRDKEPEAERLVLTARQCLTNAILGLVMVLFFSLIGLYLFHTGVAGVGWLYSIMAVALALLTAWEWKRYIAVLNGAIIFVPQPKKRSDSPEEMFVKVDSVLSLTVVALFFSGFCAWAWLTRITLPAGIWLFLLTLNGVFWIVVLFCWYRLASRWLRPKHSEAEETQEGVWPPPPIHPDDTARG